MNFDMDEFLLLGPFNATVADRPVTLGRRRERCLLAVLLLEAGRVVPVDRLVSLLWEEEPPASARRAVHAHVARIRTALRSHEGAPDLRTLGPGYLLDVNRNSVDVHRFADIVRMATLERPADRARLLREGLDLWRGPLLCDIATDQLRRRIGGAMEELRATALETWLELELDLGRHRERQPDLARAVADFPDRERFVGLRMLGLHRAGRTAEAAHLYADYRRHIVALTGIEPTADLRELQTAILRGDEPGPLVRSVVKVGIPSIVDDFVGRADEIRALDAHAAARAPVIVVSGLGGVGKTALATHWASLRGADFAAGVHFVDLADLATEEDLFDRVLAALDRGENHSSLSLAQKRDRYRAVAQRPSQLLILDNVASSATVRSLLPFAGTMLVLSRDCLDGLAVHERAARVPLRGLCPDDAIAILEMSGHLDRGASPDPRLARIAALCDMLPLALRIVGCRLAASPPGDLAGTLDIMIDDLSDADRRLTALEIDAGDEGVRAAFALSFQNLSPDEARAFMLLGLFPGRSVSLALAATMAAQPAADVARSLATLVRQSLLLRRPDGHYTMHDLIRIYARERAHDLMSDEHDTALRRVVAYYLDAAHAASTQVSPHKTHLPPPAIRFRDRHDAVAWFLAERNNLAELIPELSRRGWHRPTYDLASALFTFYHHRRLNREWIGVLEWAERSMLAEGAPEHRFRILHGLGVAHQGLGEHRRALAYYEQAWASARQRGDSHDTATVLLNLASLSSVTGDADRAEYYLAEALALPASAFDRPQQQLQLLINTGRLHYQAGRLDRAEHSLRLGLNVGDTPNPLQRIYLHLGLSEVAFLGGRTDEAAGHARTALEAAQTIGDPLRAAHALDVLASATALTDPDQATTWWREAKDLWEQAGHPLAEDLATWLHQPPPADKSARKHALDQRRVRVNQLL
jgi:DNA-binding SARP family transcriptional activator